MNRQDIAIVVFSCPKNFYLLDACFGLLRRYAENCKWLTYFATDCFEDVAVQVTCKRNNVSILELAPDNAGFLESRAALRKLPDTVRYVLPLCEDFLLERFIDEAALENALEILDVDRQVQSVRLMPCPGSSAREPFWGKWMKLLPEDKAFSYQATIWRRDLLQRFFDGLIQQGRSLYPEMSDADWLTYCKDTNPAETHPGLFLLKNLYPDAVHLCWPHKGSWANAVYWCPWPYRPTAIVQGVLQPWAAEMIRREGFVLQHSTQGS